MTSITIECGVFSFNYKSVLGILEPSTRVMQIVKVASVCSQAELCLVEDVYA